MPTEPLPMPPVPHPPDDERALLLLGLLSAQDRHGYEINDFIEHNLSHVIKLKKATAYQLLERLEHHGLIESRTEQHGQRPTRKVYHLTPAGQAHFHALLRTQLRQEEPLILTGNVPVMFSENLSRAELLADLRTRHAQLTQRLETYARQTLACTPGVELALGRIHHLTRADHDWLTQTIHELEAQAQEEHVQEKSIAMKVKVKAP